MSVAFILDFADADPGAYDRVIEKMDLGGKVAPGGIFHVAGPSNGGWRVVDVWESDEAFQDFADRQIGPLTAGEGMPAPQITRVPVHGTFDERAGGGQIAFFQVIHLDGLDEAAFDAADAQIRPGAVAPDGCVFHVNGPVEGGWLVADGWVSKDIRDRFLQERVAPVMSGSGGGPPAIDDMDVHNTLGPG
jgi:hypothetical protein